MSANTVAQAHRPTIVLCFLAAILDGIDLQSLGVAAPGLSADFGLRAGELGVVASASSFGLLFGALLAGIVADRLGRKRVLVVSVALFGLLSLATPLAWSLQSLIGIRFVTGLGMGGALPMIITIAAENSSSRRRAGAVTMMYCATPIGGIMASSIALAIPEDWRWVFYLGGVAPLLLVPALVLYLRETPLFSAATSAMAVADDGHVKPGIASLFAAGRAASTVLLWASFLGAVLVLYLLLNWLPTLLIGKGYTRPEASSVQIAFNLGGAMGALLLGWLLSRVSHRVVFGGASVAYALMLWLLAVLTGGFRAALLAGFTLGIFANGLVFLLYGLAGSVYPTLIRGTGVGSAVAVGRVGSIAGPLLAGILLTAGNTPTGVLLKLLPVIVVTALTIQWLLLLSKRAVPKETQ